MREVAQRVFAKEFEDSNLSYKKGDEKYSPNYVLTPTGAECNRLFIVGTLTEKEDIGVEVEYWRGRIVDPTGVFQIYAGQYQPDAMRSLTEIEPPTFVAVAGKVSVFTLEEGDVRTSIRPEFVVEVDEDVRDRWVLETANMTLERLRALNEKSTESAKMALEHYDTDVVYYAKIVRDALLTLRHEKREITKEAREIAEEWWDEEDVEELEIEEKKEEKKDKREKGEEETGLDLWEDFTEDYFDV
jgi:hypothetical protein